MIWGRYLSHSDNLIPDNESTNAYKSFIFAHLLIQKYAWAIWTFQAGLVNRQAIWFWCVNIQDWRLSNSSWIFSSCMFLYDMPRIFKFLEQWLFSLSLIYWMSPERLEFFVGTINFKQINKFESVFCSWSSLNLQNTLNKIWRFNT